MHDKKNKLKAFIIINILKAFNNNKSNIDSTKNIIFKIIYEENKSSEMI